MNPRQRRAILLLALALVGLVGVFALVAGYVSDIDKQVGPKERVLELTQRRAGQPGDQDAEVRDKVVPQKWAPEAALTDRTQLVGYVAAADLQRELGPPGGDARHAAADERRASARSRCSSTPPPASPARSRPAAFVDVIAAYAGSDSRPTWPSPPAPR